MQLSAKRRSAKAQFGRDFIDLPCVPWIGADDRFDLFPPADCRQYSRDRRLGQQQQDFQYPVARQSRGYRNADLAQRASGMTISLDNRWRKVNVKSIGYPPCKLHRTEVGAQRLP